VAKLQVDIHEDLMQICELTIFILCTSRHSPSVEVRLAQICN
jgi:hypothetical protein